ncbi:uncharacterized protein LOC132750073 [Ruditapes philippinarum]|uniref:uncharacterized protein LOC132750073 n=1 Tax=Ruditapes philippinarum TaxID=129788 RepID=UPI00295BDEFF|nr:uncharacterized protein LOC132750073 [Ruditapes philippinarum]
MICTEDAEINFVDGHFDIHTLPRSHVHVGKIIEDDRQKVIVNKSQNDKNQHRRSNHDIEARNELSDSKEKVEICDPPMKSSNNEIIRFDDMREMDMKPKGMMKSHYVDKNQKKACTGCQKIFKLKRKPKHCRRCGGVFCLQCVKYKRKLNMLANPDPEGKLRKVCRTCFEEGLLMIGQTRNLMDDFIQQRSFAKYGRIINSRVNSLTTTFWPDQIDIQTECLRLLTGFQEEIRQLGSANALQALKVKLKTPAWQKSNYWNIEIQSRVCRACKGDIGIRKSTGNCRVCGLALCRKCSHRELLLYLENVEISEDAKLAIINTPGVSDGFLARLKCSVLI